MKMVQGIVKFNDWEKLDLRVGKIIGVEDIEGADKLYKFEINLGSEIENRTIVAGIKQHYSKEELKGKKVIIFANLESKTLRGVESRGMILAAVEGEDDKVVLITPEQDVEIGSKVT